MGDRVYGSNPLWRHDEVPQGMQSLQRVGLQAKETPQGGLSIPAGEGHSVELTPHRDGGFHAVVQHESSGEILHYQHLKSFGSQLGIAALTHLARPEVRKAMNQSAWDVK